MNISIRGFVGLTVLFVFGSAAVNAAPTINPVTGHYYEVFADPGLSWDTAKSKVTLLPPFMGEIGHLATITSEAEDIFVESLRQATFPGNGEIWVGGVQTPGSESTKGEGWVWDNGEAAISTPFAPLPSYSNWEAGEPNDNTGAGSENHLAIGLFGNDRGWNDEGALGNIRGYVVEYDVPRELEECTESEGGCETIAGHTLVFPDDSLSGGETISFNDFEFTDDPARCGVSPLVIFGDDTDPAMTKPDLIIPPYLCGSPKFVVVAIDAGTFFLEEGSIFVTNDTAIVLPLNAYPDGGMSVCEDPIFQDPFIDGDPQYQDVVVWQATDPNDMLETTIGPGVGGSGQFAGAAGEFTKDCGGSSRARIKGASYYVVGLRIDFGPGNTWAGNSAGNFDSFVALTRYKLKLLQQSVEDARAQNGGIRGLPKNGDYKKMQKMIANAIKNLDQGEYESALDHVNNFNAFVAKATYNLIPDENFEGEHQMRGDNLAFMLRVKIILYAP